MNEYYKIGICEQTEKGFVFSGEWSGQGWVFYCKEDAEVYAKWAEFEEYTIEAVFEGDIEEPEIISFDDYIYAEVLFGFDKDSKYEDILLWLRDYGITKTRGHHIAERIMNYYKDTESAE